MFKLLKKLKKIDWVLLGISVILIVASVYVDLLIPDYMKEITTIISESGEVKSVVLTGLKMLGCCLGGTALTILSGFITSFVSSDLSYNVRKELFDHVIDLDSQTVDNFQTASLITRTTNDITQIQMFMSMGLTMLIKSPVLAVWAILKIVNKSFQLSLVTLVAVILVLTMIITITSLVLPRFRKVQKLTDEVNKVARENLTGLKVVRAFNAEKYEEEKFDKVNTELVNTQLFNRTCFSFLNPGLTLIMSTLSLAIYWIGAYLINKAGLLDKANLFSDVIVFGSYAIYVIQAFMFLAMVFMILPNAKVSANRINEVLNSKIMLREGNETNSIVTGKLEFKNVSFHYGDGKDVCENINFTVNKGETLAIIGPTGSGKTTIVSLASRIFDPTGGEVLLDDKNIKDYTFSSLYSKIAYIPQKTILFSDSIVDNLKLGKKDAKEDDIKKALNISQASEFVNNLPEKENTMLSEGGNNLSGGQKQRVAIARALCRNPEIIIFDDSFSALDYKTDKNLRNEIKTQKEGITSIIVAQRIGTIKNADKIIVVDEGRIVGMGKHHDLLKTCPLYLEIASSQLSQDELMKEGK
ncbi:MAG: ABC transporter ATP-binding protein/permease [Coprobacillus sp.]|nr:ABC transporter ATP-binding protein/permease [Coprobacillus sp.]MDY4146276.1 ABC transporter ATP-binding protein [Bacilli bacterium]